MWGGSVLVVNKDTSTGCLDTTWREIREAQASGQVVMVIVDEADYVYSYPVIETSIYDGAYLVGTSNGDTYSTDSENGYPCGGDGGTK